MLVRARPELVESLPGAIFFPKCPYCSMLETELGYWGKRAIELVGGGRDGSMLCLAEGCTCCVTDRQTSVGAIGGMHKILWVDRPFIAINVFNFCCWGTHQCAQILLQVGSRSANVPLTIPETLTCDVFLLCARVRFLGAERGALSSARRHRKQRHFSQQWSATVRGERKQLAVCIKGQCAWEGGHWRNAGIQVMWCTSG